MTMLTALSLLAALAFGLSLFVFDYLFNRFMGKEDTDYLADVMHQINGADAAEPASAAANAKTAAAA
jgi:hypothetical protein